MSIARFWCRICGDRILYRDRVKDPYTKQDVCNDCTALGNPWNGYKVGVLRDPIPVKGNLGRPVEAPDSDDQIQLSVGFTGLLS